MRSTEIFQSPWAPYLSDFVEHKQLQGYDYRQRAHLLTFLDRFLCSEKARGDDHILSAETLEAYLEHTASHQPQARKEIVGVARQFCEYLHAVDPRHAVMMTRILPQVKKRPRFYRLESEQVVDLMNACARIRIKEPILKDSVRVLIGLLYSTGLRTGEALNLNLGDIDMDRSTLLIRCGKFGKERVLSLDPSVKRALRSWLDIRSIHAGTNLLSPLLIGAYDTRLSYEQAACIFRKVCRHCGHNSRPAPRLYDLRHNYACQCLRLWREQGEDVHALLPVLSAFMGHVNYLATQVYIHMEPYDLHQAADRFKHYYQTRTIS